MANTAAKTEAATVQSDEVTKQKQTLKSQAMQQLRDLHKDEYEGLVEKLFVGAGIEYKRIPTADERKLAAAEALAKELGLKLTPIAE